MSQCMHCGLSDSTRSERFRSCEPCRRTAGYVAFEHTPPSEGHFFHVFDGRVERHGRKMALERPRPSTSRSRLIVFESVSEPEPSPSVRLCQQCRFPVRGPRALFCSNRCRDRARYEGQIAKAEESNRRTPESRRTEASMRARRA